MKNCIVLSGRLPGFNGTYTPAEGEKKSRMNWAMNVQLNTKNESGYYDEALIYFTAWGYYADALQKINSLDSKDQQRRDFSNVEIMGKLNVGYKDKEGNIQNSVSIEAQEVSFRRLMPNNDQNNSTQKTTTQNSNKPINAPKAMKPAMNAAFPAFSMR